jgi:hypothetical protein
VLDAQLPDRCGEFWLPWPQLWSHSSTTTCTRPARRPRRRHGTVLVPPISANTCGSSSPMCPGSAWSSPGQLPQHRPVAAVGEPVRRIPGHPFDVADVRHTRPCGPGEPRRRLCGPVRHPVRRVACGRWPVTMSRWTHSPSWNPISRRLSSASSGRWRLRLLPGMRSWRRVTASAAAASSNSAPTRTMTTSCTSIFVLGPNKYSRRTNRLDAIVNFLAAAAEDVPRLIAEIRGLQRRHVVES